MIGGWGESPVCLFTGREQLCLLRPENWDLRNYLTGALEDPNFMACILKVGIKE